MPLTAEYTPMELEPLELQRPIEFHRFLSLPRELRDNIYAHVIFNQPQIISHASRQHFPQRSTLLLPNICLASHQTHTEATQAYFRHTVLLVPLCIHPFLAYLSEFPSRSGFYAIRSLFIPTLYSYAPPYPKPLTIARGTWPSSLTSACPGLTELRVEFTVLRLLRLVWLDKEPGRYKYVIENLDVVEGRMRLGRVFEHQGLKRLDVVVREVGVYARILGFAKNDLLRGFGNWLAGKSREMGGRVVVHVRSAEEAPTRSPG